MPLTLKEIDANALTFSKRWRNAQSEKSEAQSFLAAFLRVFGIDDPAEVGRFEKEAERASGKTGYMDYMIPGLIGIEMKSKGKNLDEAYRQLRDYVGGLPLNEIPELLMVSDFENIRIQQRTGKGAPITFKTEELHKYIRRFSILAGLEPKSDMLEQFEINVKAAEKMATLHDALKNYGYDGHELEVYLVRILFCLFAEDTAIFPRQHFREYIYNSKANELSNRLDWLFELLNMPPEKRAKRTRLTADELAFQYVNGDLFKQRLPHADFDEKMQQTLIECCNFDWSLISPVIFGAMFQGVMDKRKRREIGAHYTSRENILKVINPLFMDKLRDELKKAKASDTKLNEFHDKLSKLKFLDPACGCGNFLMVAYQELRELEFELLKLKNPKQQKVFNVEALLKVSVEQFYGIEIEDFPCEVARVGMWLVDHQMNRKVSQYFGGPYARLPLGEGSTIIHGNALVLDWENIVPKDELSYILSNPPYVGYSNQSKEQKADMLAVWKTPDGKPLKGAGKIDYVAAWYYKAAEYMAGTSVKTAFVSTNSVTQGEQVAAVWKPIFEHFNVHIDFAYRTFKWSNEAKGKAAVHCVIIGFSCTDTGKRILYDGDVKVEAKNINPYLVDAPNIFIESRRTPLCAVPEMIAGNRPADGGHLIIEDIHLENFVQADPLSKKHIRQFIGSEEFINNKKRWCLWLVGATPNELKRMPEVMKRIAACKKDRENSPDAGRRQLAATPALFREQISSTVDYIVIPKVSSERRNYVPIGWVPPTTIASDLLFLIPESTMYHFGILTSNVHNAWMRTVCGRLKSDYRYSKNIVYNNFPWPITTDKQKETIEQLAQNILEIRSEFPESSLAELYDPLTMPKNLLKAHKALDRAVMKLYGFKTDWSEQKIVAALIERYQELFKQKKS